MTLRLKRFRTEGQLLIFPWPPKKNISPLVLDRTSYGSLGGLQVNADSTWTSLGPVVTMQWGPEPNQDKYLQDGKSYGRPNNTVPGITVRNDHLLLSEGVRGGHFSQDKRTQRPGKSNQITGLEIGAAGLGSMYMPGSMSCPSHLKGGYIIRPLVQRFESVISCSHGFWSVLREHNVSEVYGR